MFTGTWPLRSWAPDSGEKRCCLHLTVACDGEERNYMAYSTCLTLGYADKSILHMIKKYVQNLFKIVN